MSGSQSTDEGAATGANVDDQIKNEMEEEKKLMTKYPQVQRPGSQFLQKRLQRGQKYFDSGDYNMAKATMKPNVKLPASTLSHPPSTNSPLDSVNSSPGSNSGGQSPTPKSIALSEPTPAIPTGELIPTPDCLAHRKSSIHSQSKLVSE